MLSLIVFNTLFSTNFFNQGISVSTCFFEWTNKGYFTFGSILSCSYNGAFLFQFESISISRKFFTFKFLSCFNRSFYRWCFKAIREDTTCWVFNSCLQGICCCIFGYCYHCSLFCVISNTSCSGIHFFYSISMNTFCIIVNCIKCYFSSLVCFCIK